MDMMLKIPDTDLLPVRFSDLFKGAMERHGTYDPGKLWRNAENSKMEMKDEDGNGPRDVEGPPTAELWSQHLAGEKPLGVSPTREDGMCRWVVGDIDGKDVPGGYGAINHAEIAAKSDQHEFGIFVARSKSGGAHTLLLLREWTPQATANELMTIMLEVMGVKGSDVFPNAKGRGNWLNMPYFGGNDSDRCVVRADGSRMTMVEFLDAAEGRRVTTTDQIVMCKMREMLAEARKTSAKPDKKKTAASKQERAARDLDRFADEIAKASEGGRGKLLFGRAKDMGRRIGAGVADEDDVSSRLLAAGMMSGLKFGEATGHIKNGIEAGRHEPEPEDADSDRYPEIEKITIHVGGEDTQWTVTVAGHGDIMLPVKDVMNYWTFNVRCAERLRTSFRQMKNDAWSDRINASLKHAEVVTVAPDETIEGMFRDALQAFCLDYAAGREMDELHLGNPVRPENEDRIYFRFKDFRRHLEVHAGVELRTAKIQVLGKLLTGIGKDGVDVGKTTKKLAGRTVEVRWVRAALFEPLGRIALPPPPKRDPL